MTAGADARGSAVLAALFRLEAELRDLPVERRVVAITLAVSRLRRLHPHRPLVTGERDAAAQLDLERDLLIGTAS